MHQLTNQNFMGSSGLLPFQLRKDAVPFPGYRLENMLGKGGWGEVWRATTESGRSVALKFLPCENQQAAIQEIRALQNIRQLKHRFLLQIDQVWCIANYLVIAMELAEGSLLDLLDTYLAEYQAPIFADHVCFYLSQAAEALDFINTRQHFIDHQRVAFRHCDVKPSNLLIQGQSVKLADFSLVVQTASVQTPYRRMGTPYFAAPEIAQGLITDRTDQYSLAVTYCQLRGGRFPFPEAPRIVGKTLEIPTLDLSMLSPPERPIIKRALAPVPQDRWASCKIMMQKLSACLSKALTM